MHKLRFRQVHLDFHTSPAIEHVGEKFDKKQWQDALQIGHVNSITCFAKCHHGWSYNNTKVGKRHPNLNFDLLRAQFDAAKEIDVNVPIYLSAGYDNMITEKYPQWRQIDIEGKVKPAENEPGFHLMCFNSPYLDYLCDQIREVVQLFPNADGIFLDIVFQGQCCCKQCRELMEKKNLDVNIEADRKQCAQIVLQNYYEKTVAACKSLNKDMPVFHNSGHIERGNRNLLKYYSHLELESLPTGGWGYDHFPISAKYCKNLPYDFLGMTGKFHTCWGEFGGYKHPNALQYECSAMLAYGAKCSVGDQLNPEAKMDETTYKIIGSAYKDVESKEPWCTNAENITDIGLLSAAATNAKEQGGMLDESPDTGAGRILLEGHFLFDVLDTEMDFSKYKILILPDEVKINAQLKNKLIAYLAAGGKLFLTGTSGLADDGSGFIFDIGAKWLGQSEYQPDYVLPSPQLRPSFVNSPLVMYLPSQRIKITSGKSLGDIYDPYFNRTGQHFCSHQHAPARPERSGFDCGVLHKQIMYLAHPVFSIYKSFGAVAYKEYIINAIKSLLGQPTVETNLPSTARITLTKQAEHSRYVLHLLYANTINRGGSFKLLDWVTKGVEVIDELIPLHNITVKVNSPLKITDVVCVPQNEKLKFEQKEGIIKFTLPGFQCHQMIELKFQ